MCEWLFVRGCLARVLHQPTTTTSNTHQGSLTNDVPGNANEMAAVVPDRVNIDELFQQQFL